MPASIVYDSHMHTPLCKHASGEPEAYAAVAEMRGLRGIIITDHNPVPDWAPKVRMDVEQLDEYVALVERARDAWRGRVDVRLGLESDYAPGMESYLEQLHARADFEFILGSVHAGYPEYKERYLRNNDARDFQRTYYEHLAQAAETGLFDAISHPDLVKLVFPGRWKPEAILDTIGHSLDRIAKTSVAMELNTSGLRKAAREIHPGPLILRAMAARGIPVVLGSDAHKPDSVAAGFDKAFDALEAAGYAQIHTYLNHEPYAVALDAARHSLQLPAGA